MTFSLLDKMFFVRAGFGVAFGVVSELTFGADWESGILLAFIGFMVSYYLLRAMWGKSLEPKQINKLYTAGIGTYVLLYLFWYILLYTMGVTYLTL